MMIGSLIKPGMKGPQYLPLLCVSVIIMVSAASRLRLAGGTSTAVASQNTPAVVSISEIIKNPSAYNKTDVLAGEKSSRNADQAAGLSSMTGPAHSTWILLRTTLPSHKFGGPQSLFTAPLA